MIATVKFFIYMSLIIIALYISGCSDSTKTEQYSNKTNPQQDVVVLQEVQSTDHQPAPKKTTTVHTTPKNDSKNVTTETTEIVLYFSNGKGKLAPERRKIKKVPGVARETVSELCLGPEISGLEPTIPPHTSLLDINIKGGLCTVNLSKEFITNHSGGSTAENTTIYSLVNTLSQFQSVEAVQILVEGKEISTLAGHMDISGPLTRDPELVTSI